MRLKVTLADLSAVILGFFSRAAPAQASGGKAMYRARLARGAGIPSTGTTIKF